MYVKIFLWLFIISVWFGEKGPDRIYFFCSAFCGINLVINWRVISHNEAIMTWGLNEFP